VISEFFACEQKNLYLNDLSKRIVSKTKNADFYYLKMFLKGAMDKKADGDICAHFLCFSIVFSEIFSISFF
jgi:hypothetical protein